MVLRARVFARLLTLLCLVAAARDAGAQPSEAARLLGAGNRHYASGEYEQARDAYEQAVATGYVSGILYYNLGNVYYRLDEIGQAIRYYRKARRLLPNDLRVQHNLEITRTRTVDQLTAVPDPYWEVWWQRLVRTIGAGGLFITGFLFYLAALALLAYRILTPSRSAWLRRAAAASLASGLLLMGTAYLASFIAVQHDGAVVLAETLALRQEPSLTATTEQNLHEGTLIEVVDEQDGWLHIRLPNGTTGWIEAGHTAEI